MMKKFKLGDKVRVLDASEIGGGCRYYYSGMLTEVVDIDWENDIYLRAKDGSRGIHIARCELHAIEKVSGGDTVKYETEKRKARVGERILITDAGMSLGYYSNGDILTVHYTGRNGAWVYARELEGIDGGNFHIDYSEYEVIVDDPETDRIAALESEVETLKAKVETLEKNKAAKTDKDAVDFASALAFEMSQGTIRTKKTPNQASANSRRADAIKQAREFVAESATERDGTYRVNHTEFLPGIRDYGFATCNATFHVNAEKRTVVALMHGDRTRKLRAKGIAKCAPGDVFNADIGKAIAAGRLYGVKVPDAIMNAPQPSEFEVGQVTQVPDGRIFVITEIDGDKARTKPGSFHRKSEFPRITITDDTEAQY